MITQIADIVKDNKKSPKHWNALCSVVRQIIWVFGDFFMVLIVQVWQINKQLLVLHKHNLSKYKSLVINFDLF